MTKDLQNIYAKLVILETEVSDLRQGYVIINRRYSNALASLKDLTALATEAAKRSANGAIKAAEAAKNASTAATEAAAIPVLKAADAAADAASAAAESAIEAAAAGGGGKCSCSGSRCRASRRIFYSRFSSGC